MKKKSMYFRASILLYLISMGLPVYGLNWEFLGYKAVGAGWAAIPASEPFIAIPWLANFLFLANIFLPSKWFNIRSTLAVLAIVMSLFVYIEYKPDLLPGLGFFVWLSSFLLMLGFQVQCYKNLDRLRKYRGL